MPQNDINNVWDRVIDYANGRVPEKDLIIAPDLTTNAPDITGEEPSNLMKLVKDNIPQANSKNQDPFQLFYISICALGS